MENESTEKRQPIRSRILRFVLSIAAASLAITSLFGILSMLGIQKEAEDALTEQAKDNLTNVIESKTALAEQRINRYSEIVSEFTYYVEEIVSSPEKYKSFDLDSPDTYDTGDLVFSYGIASEELDWNDFKDESGLFVNAVHSFYPVISENRNIIQTTYFGFDNGLLLSYDDASESVPPELVYYNFFDTSWYKLGKNTDKPVFTEPYVDSFGRGITMTCVNPIHDKDGSVIGALGMDMGITDLYDYILDLDLGDGASAFITDANGNIIDLSTDENGTTQTLTDIESSDRQRMDNFSDGIVVGDNMYYAFSTIESVGWKLCVRVPKSDVLQLANDIGQDIVSAIIVFIIFFLAILVTVVIVVYEFSENITRPIMLLTKDVGEISAGDLDHRATVCINDEIGDLAKEFNVMTESLKDYINSLTAVTAEKERISAELGIAAKIQADMMPRNFPKRGDFAIYAAMTPAKEVGGDFYDFFMIDDDRLCLVMADVSGKGVTASLFMVIAKTLIKTRATASGTPAQMLWDINNTLCADNPRGLFVTAWFGILTLSTGKLEFSNAGHEYPAIRHANGDFELVIAEHCPPLATIENIEFTDESMTLEAGDEIFLYTDGVPEAKASDGSRFGTDKMLEILNRDKKQTPEEILKDLKKEIDDFAGAGDPFDDITMMGFVWNGNNN